MTMTKCLVVGLLTAGFAGCSAPPPTTAAASAPPAMASMPEASGPKAPPTTDAGMMESALAAAPEAVSKDATIIAMDDKMQVRTLRKGTSDWTCMPDNPQSPGADPMCVDKNGLAWAMAWMEHKDPPKGKVGLGYMLMGGSDASNDDPFASAPAAGHKWVETGPHVMVLNATDVMTKYPTSADNTKAPYVMFAGTKYAHLMVPIK